jgi:RNA polymerase sigma-70 factor, ECF subfamily
VKETNAAFDLLMPYREDVFRICLGFCADYEEAEDLAQDVYIKAVRGIDRLRDSGQARAWIIRIARNAGLDHCRRARRRGQLLRTWASTAPKPDDPAEPLDVEGRPDPRLAALKSSVAELPARFREVFVLREYGHLSYEEIGRELGLSAGTVMSRLFRARARIAAEVRGRS